MNFINTFEELNKLYESVEPEIAEVAEEAAEEISEAAQVSEGIFDSKATKQKKYEQEVNDVFKAPSVRLASEVASNAARVIEQVAAEISAGNEGSAATTAAKNVIKLIKGAIAEAKGKTPLALVKAAVSIGAKYEPNADGLDELREFASKVLKLSDVKVRQYLMEKVNAAIERNFNQTISMLKREYNISEALEEAAGTDEAEDDEAVIEIVSDDEPTEDKVEAPEENASEESPVMQRLILECSNCGALMIKDESDVVVDADSDLANIEEACQYCEEAAGYIIAGVVAPYEAVEAEETEKTEAAEDGIEDEAIAEEE